MTGFNKKHFGVLFLVLAIVSVLASVGVRADEGTDDPDFDYLPPKELGFFETFKEYTYSYFRGPSHAGAYETAKKRLYENIDDQQSFYCGCKMNLEKRTLDRLSCAYVPRKDNDRAKRIEAEHVLPAFWIAKFYTGKTCWIKDEKTCGGARDCCLKNDARFKKAHNDLVNLLPAIGELNLARSNLIYDLVKDEPRLFGRCDFEVDRGKDVAEPKKSIRGDVARVYFYMRDTYSLKYPAALLQRLNEWNKADPVSEEEITRNQRIKDTQGTANSYVE